MLHRGEAPPPIRDRRSAEQIGRLEGKGQWLLSQYEQLTEQLIAAGLVPRLAHSNLDEPMPRSRGVQDRAIEAAVVAVKQKYVAREAKLQTALAARKELVATLRQQLAEASGQ